MKILITGAGGQLGYDTAKEALSRGHETYPMRHMEMDITDGRKVREIMELIRPDTVIHCAAYTAVDLAEKERSRCYEVNVEGTKNLVRECGKTKAAMIYISTDYVFSGEGRGPNMAKDPTCPLNWYGKTKRMGEKLVEELPFYSIVRTGWLFGAHGQNFVSKLLELGRKYPSVRVATDQTGSPTYTKDLARLLLNMAENRGSLNGIYHASNEGYCTRREFVREIFRQYNVSAEVIPVTTADYEALYPGSARRPLNGRLDQTELRAKGFISLPKWEDALERYRRETES